MSLASRLAAADSRIVKVIYDGNIGLNRAHVPGGISAVVVEAPLYAGGLNWLPADAEPWSASIGYQLAAELNPSLTSENPS